LDSSWSAMRKGSLPPNPAAVEERINLVRGVYASQVILSPTNEIQEIHVLASSRRNPKQIVRDIESLMLVIFGVRLDYRKISLVQVDEARFEQWSPRVRLQQVRMTTEHGNRRAQVNLQLGPREVTGEAVGERSDALGDAELAAQATLRAVRELSDAMPEIRLQELRGIELQSGRAVLVCLEVVVPEGEQPLFDASQNRLGAAGLEGRLLGAAWVRGDLPTAAARAVLAALNRRLPVLRRSEASDLLT